MENNANNEENEKPFSFLYNIKENHISDFIVNEHPQTIALILSHLDSRKAADILQYFPEEFSSEITMRIAKLGDINPLVIKRVSVVLESKLETLSMHKIEVGGVKAVANILNNLKSTTSQYIINKISEIDEDLSSMIRKFIFTFEDIKLLSSKDIIIILKTLNMNDLMLALKNDDGKLINKFTEQMNEKVMANFLIDLNKLGRVKITNVLEAQRTVLSLIEKLIQSGTIYETKELTTHPKVDLNEKARISFESIVNAVKYLQSKNLELTTKNISEQSKLSETTVNKYRKLLYI